MFHALALAAPVSMLALLPLEFFTKGRAACWFRPLGCLERCRGLLGFISPCIAPIPVHQHYVTDRKLQWGRSKLLKGSCDALPRRPPLSTLLCNAHYVHNKKLSRNTEWSRKVGATKNSKLKLKKLFFICSRFVLSLIFFLSFFFLRIFPSIFLAKPW